MAFWRKNWSAFVIAVIVFSIICIAAYICYTNQLAGLLSVLVVLFLGFIALYISRKLLSNVSFTEKWRVDFCMTAVGIFCVLVVLCFGGILGMGDNIYQAGGANQASIDAVTMQSLKSSYEKSLHAQATADAGALKQAVEQARQEDATVLRNAILVQNVQRSQEECSPVQPSAQKNCYSLGLEAGSRKALNAECSFESPVIKTIPANIAYLLVWTQSVQKVCVGFNIGGEHEVFSYRAGVTTYGILIPLMPNEHVLDRSSGRVQMFASFHDANVAICNDGLQGLLNYVSPESIVCPAP